MNKTFKVIYNRARLGMTAVSEIARSVQKKGTKTVLATGVALLFSLGGGVANAENRTEPIVNGTVSGTGDLIFTDVFSTGGIPSTVKADGTNQTTKINGYDGLYFKQTKDKTGGSALLGASGGSLTVNVKTLEIGIEESPYLMGVQAFGGTVVIEQAERISMTTNEQALMAQYSGGSDGSITISAEDVSLRSKNATTIVGGSYDTDVGKTSIDVNASNRLTVSSDNGLAVMIYDQYRGENGQSSIGTGEATVTLAGTNGVNINAETGTGIYILRQASTGEASSVTVKSPKGEVRVSARQSVVLATKKGEPTTNVNVTIDAQKITLGGDVRLGYLDGSNLAYSDGDQGNVDKRKLTLIGTTTINGEVKAASGTLIINGETIFNKNATIGKLEGVDGKDTQLTLGDKDATISVAKNEVGADKLTLGATGSVNDALGGDVTKLKDKFQGSALKDGATVKMAEGMAAGEVTAKVGANGTLTDVTTKTNSVMSNVLDISSVTALSLNRILMNDVRKRLGDVRSTEGAHGAWVRYDGGKLTGSNSLKNNFTTVQMGIDTVPSQDAPRFGAALAYTRSDADMRRGDATMDTYSLALYGTKFFENGLFVDVIGRAALSNADYTVDSDKKGSADNTALSLSGEIGWRYDATSTLFVEPQAELTYTYTDADALKLKNATSEQAYSFDKVDSLLGRVGFAAGYTCPEGRGNVYVHASAVHEFLGDATIRSGLNSYKVNGEDTWAEYGIGANYNLNKNAYIYAGLERTDGGRLDEEWRAHAGVRLAF